VEKNREISKWGLFPPSSDFGGQKGGGITSTRDKRVQQQRNLVHPWNFKPKENPLHFFQV
jgi:hypothetical protein